VSRPPDLDAKSREALREFWKFYEPIASEISAELRERSLQLPAFAPIIRATPQAMADAQSRKSMDLQRAAILDDRWQAYLDDLTEQGMGFAKMGIDFPAWFQLLGQYRDTLRRRIVAAHGPHDLGRAQQIADGMNLLLDIAMGSLGEAYLLAKEEIIRSQQEAIREISTPVLQIRDQVLILPVVGLVDTHRARLLTETLLSAIRERRARAVVMDVTGVPLVDSKVAKHIAQTCEAARLMGAVVLITGISPEIAQTLVTVGAELPGVLTLGDLQSGIEEVERLLDRATHVPGGAR
jgi:rsbT co-antagonist protein RsbR